MTVYKGRGSVALKGLKGVLLIGASAVVLTGCLPEDEAILSEADVRNTQVQSKIYAQAFQQFARKSLDALVNNERWANRTVAEGELDVAGDFGVDMGMASSYIKSAYCNSGGQDYHISWFGQDGDNPSDNLSLKGVGASQSGIIASEVQKLIPREQMARVIDGEIKTNKDIDGDGSRDNLVLSGGCSNLVIPNNNIVAFFELEAPNQVAANAQKTVMRTISCPAGQSGVIVQSVTASIGAGEDFASKAALLADDSAGWATITSDCVADTQAVALDVAGNAVSALSGTSLIGLDGGIAGALRSNLEDLDCIDVQQDKVDDEGDKSQTEQEKATVYNTCGDEIDLALMADTSIIRKELLDEDIQSQELFCPSTMAKNGDFTVEIGSEASAGLPDELDGQTGTISTSQGDIFGSVLVDIVTSKWAVTRATSDGEQETEIVENKTYQASSPFQCNANHQLSFSCEQALSGSSIFDEDEAEINDPAEDNSGIRFLFPYSVLSVSSTYYDEARTESNPDRVLIEQYGQPIIADGSGHGFKLIDNPTSIQIMGDSILTESGVSLLGKSYVESKKCSGSGDCYIDSSYENSSYSLNDNILTVTTHFKPTTHESGGMASTIVSSYDRVVTQYVLDPSGQEVGASNNMTTSFAGTGPRYNRRTVLDDWADEEKLKLAAPYYRASWEQSRPMNCVVTQIRTRNTGCTEVGGDFGRTSRGLTTEERTRTISEDGISSWTQWEEISYTPVYCSNPGASEGGGDGGGGGGGGSQQYNDVNGNGSYDAGTDTHGYDGDSSNDRVDS